MATRRQSNATGTILELFMDVAPEDFGARVQDLRTAEKAICDTVIEQVEQHNLSPMQGLGVIGCAASQLYGWQAFHGQPTFADLWSTTQNYQG